MNDNPVAIITGASRGIGAATAIQFAQSGFDCSLIADDEAGLNEVAAQIEKTGRKVLTFVGDLADLDFAETAIKSSLTAWQRVDVLVNNAAWREITTMRKIDLASWEKTLRICLTTPAFLAKWCCEAMENRQRGVILNVSSIQSRFPAGISPAYVSAKGAIDALTHELAILYGPSGIRVLSVNPGAIDTELSRGYGPSQLDQTIRNYVEGMIPLRRYGRAEEIAKTLVMLASDAASYLTGTCIEVDGGWHHQATPYALKHMQFPDQFSS